MTSSFDSGIGAGTTGVYPWTPVRLYLPPSTSSIRGVAVGGGVVAVAYLDTLAGGYGRVLFGVASGPGPASIRPLALQGGVTVGASDYTADGALRSMRVLPLDDGAQR